MASSIDNLINVAFRKGQDLSGFGLKVGGKGDYRPPQFDAESLKLKYINTTDSYALEFNRTRFLEKGFTFEQVHDFTRASSATFIGPNRQIQLAPENTPRFTYDPITGELLGILFGLDATLKNKVVETVRISDSLQYSNLEGGVYEISGYFSQGAPVLFSDGNAMVRANRGGQQTVRTGYVNASFNKKVSLGIGITTTLSHFRGSGGARALNIFEHLDNALQEWPTDGV